MRKLKELISIREVVSPVSTTIRTLANTQKKKFDRCLILI